MQLFIILALILYGGGRSNTLLDRVKPMLEEMGGEDLKNAFREAEELTNMLSAVKELMPAAPAPSVQDIPETPAGEPSSGGFPLQPVIHIADRDIAYSLSKYLSA